MMGMDDRIMSILRVERDNPRPLFNWNSSFIYFLTYDMLIQGELHYAAYSCPEKRSRDNLGCY